MKPHGHIYCVHGKGTCFKGWNIVSTSYGLWVWTNETVTIIQNFEIDKIPEHLYSKGKIICSNDPDFDVFLLSIELESWNSASVWF